MAHMTPGQLANRDRVDALIGLAAPFLDIELGVGERISRLAAPADTEYYPSRPGGPGTWPGEPGYEDDGGLPPPEPPASA